MTSAATTPTDSGMTNASAPRGPGDGLADHEIELIRADVEIVAALGDDFVVSFYDAVFDMAPAARAMFPDDMTEQRRKLLAELAALVTLAVSAGDDPAAFDRRAGSLGRRHVGYGVQASHYDVVGAALLATFGRHVPDWDDAHLGAWTRLYGMVAAAMLAGASEV